VLCLNLLTFVALPTSLVAQEAADITRFDDWELHCSDGVGCRMTQRLVVEETRETVFLITILPGDEAGAFAGIVSVPLRGYLAPGIELQVDARTPFQLLYETCDPSGCHAGFALEGRVLQEFRAGLKARFRVWTARDEPVVLDISLIGFTRAFEALAEQI
jgi:invasion protein IalB